MKATPNQGLCGKARRVHHRNRAARLHARQWVDEYFDRDTAEPPGHRYIPIRGRSEFLPTVARVDRSAARGRDGQLELPLTTAGRADNAGRAVATARTVPDRGAGPTKDVVIRFPSRSQSPVGRAFKPPMQFGPRNRFTIGGFLLGCAMGSAAAAAVLLVVRVTVG